MNGKIHVFDSLDCEGFSNNSPIAKYHNNSIKIGALETSSFDSLLIEAFPSPAILFSRKNKT